MNQPLGGVCIFYPYPCGFSLATLDPSHSPETYTLVLLESLDDPSVWVCELMSRAYSTVSPGDHWDTLQNPPSPWLVITVNWRVGNLIVIIFGNHFGMIMIVGHCVLQYTEAESTQKGFLCGCPFHKDHICVCSRLSVMNSMEGFISSCRVQETKWRTYEREKCREQESF